MMLANRAALGAFAAAKVRHLGHLLSGLEQHFSAANQSIGPTKNALPTKYNPRPTGKASSPLAWQRNQTPLLKQNRKARTAATRDNIFKVLCCLLYGANDVLRRKKAAADSRREPRQRNGQRQWRLDAPAIC